MITAADIEGAECSCDGHFNMGLDAPIPLGAGLCTAVIGPPALACDVFGIKVSPMQVDSDRGQFNWAWPLTDIKPFDEPVPMRGMQGFFDWPFPIQEAA